MADEMYVDDYEDDFDAPSPVKATTKTETTNSGVMKSTSSSSDIRMSSTVKTDIGGGNDDSSPVSTQQGIIQQAGGGPPALLSPPSVSQMATAERRSSKPLVSQRTPTPPTSAKLISKDGDVCYDSDEGFSVIRTNQSNNNGGSRIESEMSNPPSIGRIQDAPQPPPPPPPRAPSSEPEEEPVARRYESSDDENGGGGIGNNIVQRSYTPSSTESTPRYVTTSQQPLPTESIPIGVPTTSNQNTLPVPPRYSGSASDDDHVQQQSGDDDGDDAYSDDFDMRASHNNSQMKEAWPPGRKSPQSQSPTPVGSDNNTNIAETLQRKNKELQQTIQELIAQMNKIKPIVRKQPPPKKIPGGPDAATLIRIQTEYNVVKKENDALRGKVKTFQKLDNLERRLAEQDKELEELNVQKKLLQADIRNNTRRLMRDGSAVDEKRQKFVQELKTEKQVVHAVKKKTEKMTQLESNHKDFLENQITRAKDETDSVDPQQLKAIQALTVVLEERQKDVEALQYRIEVLRKAKESAARVASTQAATCRDAQDVQLLRREIALLHEKIEHFETQLGGKKGDAVVNNVVRELEPQSRGNVDRQEQAEWKLLMSQFKKGKDTIIAAFISSRSGGGTKATAVVPKKPNPPPSAPTTQQQQQPDKSNNTATTTTVLPKVPSPPSSAPGISNTNNNNGVKSNSSSPRPKPFVQQQTAAAAAPPPPPPKALAANDDDLSIDTDDEVEVSPKKQPPPPPQPSNPPSTQTTTKPQQQQPTWLATSAPPNNNNNNNATVPTATSTTTATAAVIPSQSPPSPPPSQQQQQQPSWLTESSSTTNQSNTDDAAKKVHGRRAVGAVGPQPTTQQNDDVPPWLQQQNGSGSSGSMMNKGLNDGTMNANGSSNRVAAPTTNTVQPPPRAAADDTPAWLK